MNDNPIKMREKKRLLSIPAIILGVLLIGALVPIINDFDNDEKRDSISKYLMFKVMSSQEKAKEAAEDGMYKHSAEIEAKRQKMPKSKSGSGPDFSKGETGGFGPSTSSNTKAKTSDEGSDNKKDE